MKKISVRQWLILSTLIAITNFFAYQCGKNQCSSQILESINVGKATLDHDKDVVIIVARPEKKSEGDILDDKFFRSHIIEDKESYINVGKGNLLKYRGHIFSKKPLKDEQYISVLFH